MKKLSATMLIAMGDLNTPLIANPDEVYQSVQCFSPETDYIQQYKYSDGSYTWKADWIYTRINMNTLQALQNRNLIVFRDVNFSVGLTAVELTQDGANYAAGLIGRDFIKFLREAIMTDKVYGNGKKIPSPESSREKRAIEISGTRRAVFNYTEKLFIPGVRKNTVVIDQNTSCGGDFISYRLSVMVNGNEQSLGHIQMLFFGRESIE